MPILTSAPTSRRGTGFPSGVAAGDEPERVRLVAESLSNGEIAARLVPRSV
jgi:hypothetical protein